MNLLKNFWLYAALFFVLVLGVIALAIWESTDPASPLATNVSTSANASSKDKESSAQLASKPFSQEPIPDNFPAPAKKLHQLINDNELSDAQTLDEKTQQLDKQLAEINKQLKAQGINVPDQQPQTAATDSDTDTKERLNTLKEYLESKGDK